MPILLELDLFLSKDLRLNYRAIIPFLKIFEFTDRVTRLAFSGKSSNLNSAACMAFMQPSL